MSAMDDTDVAVDDLVTGITYILTPALPIARYINMVPTPLISTPSGQPWHMYTITQSWVTLTWSPYWHHPHPLWTTMNFWWSCMKPVRCWNQFQRPGMMAEVDVWATEEREKHEDQSSCTKALMLSHLIVINRLLIHYYSASTGVGLNRVGTVPAGQSLFTLAVPLFPSGWAGLGFCSQFSHSQSFDSRHQNHSFVDVHYSSRFCFNNHASYSNC